MKVLCVSVLLDPITGGGTAERTYQLSRALVSAGAECTVVTTDVGLLQQRIDSLQAVKVVALPCILQRFFVVRFSWKKLKQLVAAVDVVHLMGHWNMLNVLVYLAARRTRTPYVICPAGELPLFGRSRWIKRIFNVLIGRKIVRNAAGYIAVTPDEIPAYAAYGVASEQVTVIPNGIDEADFQPNDGMLFAQRYGIGANPFILFMGRLNPIKGPDLLIQAFIAIAERFPRQHLVFAGPDGGLLTSLKQVAAEHGMTDRIHFVGYVAGQDKVNAYREADFLVIPSRQEAMSIVVLEAGIVGTPVLLTDRCGFNEVETIGGGRVTAATVNALADGAQSLLENRQGLSGMGARLSDLVKKSFTWSVIVRCHLELFERVAISKRGCR